MNRKKSFEYYKRWFVNHVNNEKSQEIVDIVSVISDIRYDVSRISGSFQPLVILAI